MDVAIRPPVDVTADVHVDVRAAGTNRADKSTCWHVGADVCGVCVAGASLLCFVVLVVANTDVLLDFGLIVLAADFVVVAAVFDAFELEAVVVDFLLLNDDDNDVDGSIGLGWMAILVHAAGCGLD